MTENVENYDVNNRILDIFFYDSDNFVSHIINNKLLFLYKKLFFKIHLNAILFSQQAMDVNNDGGGIFVNHLFCSRRVLKVLCEIGTDLSFVIF